MDRVDSGIRASGLSIGVNLVLALVKVLTGLVGNSYALVADGIESAADVVSSAVVWGGLRISTRPPDRSHPYGHGKAESLAGVAVAAAIVLAAGIIAVQSVQEIKEPHGSPAWYTLVVLALVITAKETMFRRNLRVGDSLNSRSLVSDAWHHRSDAVSSLAAFIGISIALIGGKGYEAADDWAALAACGIILYNGFRLLRPALDEVMDAAVTGDVEEEIRGIASKVPGVVEVEKCRVRKSGLGLLMDIHVVVRGGISVREGHRIGHAVKDRLTESHLPISDVVVHVEPDGSD
ncbi:MAG: cation diffusion facilitator family transporter, partial [Candidatus Eisenbacteria bacterium]